MAIDEARVSVLPENLGLGQDELVGFSKEGRSSSNPNNVNMGGEDIVEIEGGEEAVIDRFKDLPNSLVGARARNLVTDVARQDEGQVDYGVQEVLVSGILSEIEIAASIEVNDVILGAAAIVFSTCFELWPVSMVWLAAEVLLILKMDEAIVKNVGSNMIGGYNIIYVWVSMLGLLAVAFYV
ncbi:hypothetical protein LOK49_LG12G01489 [Camellia lanceoleosa]|uniref:Uncharacterized protein n=1 Tax=Camellia lanceoleosa TaxID=1840588 RepID=A0ACC0FRY3_9ERIC|nr:hypothetical protein LOK49_LG12G01489 [Camellia lanceoleosa]